MIIGNELIVMKIKATLFFQGTAITHTAAYAKPFNL